MFEGFAYVIVALVGGYGALTGYLPSMLISLFGDTKVLTVTKGSPIGWGGLLSPGAKQPSGPPGSGIIPGVPPIFASLTSDASTPTYTGEPLGPGGPVISGPQTTGSEDVSA